MTGTAGPPLGTLHSTVFLGGCVKGRSPVYQHGGLNSGTWRSVAQAVGEDGVSGAGNDAIARRVSGTDSSNNLRPWLPTAGCTVRLSASMAPATNSERLVSTHPETMMWCGVGCGSNLSVVADILQGRVH